MLDRTRAHFAGLSDEPCLGADSLAPADTEADSWRSAGTGAGPLLPAGSRAALRFLDGSGAVLPTSASSEAGP
jgi:hypothetical protein